tara:strand:+ start:389 stop:1090 length:702 start_codon:yes stop_codon:yes gene_type:complete
MNNKIELKPLLIVSATQKDNAKDTRLHASSGSYKDQAKFEFITRNTQGLPKLYNKYLTKKVEEKHDIVVFCHDDLYIDDVKLRGKLYKSIFADGYDIVGLAGASTCRIDIDTPSLWHLMSERGTHSGTIYHPVAENTQQVMSSTFGPIPQRCLILDGVFLAVNIQKARSVKWKFDTNFDFHHYDLAACMSANEKKLKMGTALIHTVHDSPGLPTFSDPVWHASHKRFVELYNS